MQALLGAMEQQEVTIAKAGVCSTLPARTSVIAAANPSGGHYTRAKTISENLKLSTAMLSRFDITFLLLDRPDEALDEKLSEHILALHAGTPSSSPKTLLLPILIPFFFATPFLSCVYTPPAYLSITFTSSAWDRCLWQACSKVPLHVLV